MGRCIRCREGKWQLTKQRDRENHLQGTVSRHIWGRFGDSPMREGRLRGDPGDSGSGATMLPAASSVVKVLMVGGVRDQTGACGGDGGSKPGWLYVAWRGRAAPRLQDEYAGVGVKGDPLERPGGEAVLAVE